MKNNILKTFSALLLSFLIINNVNAKGVLVGDSTINDTGTYESSRFAFGNTVESKSQVDGISVIAGNALNIKGKHTYGAYAGNIITINTEIEKDLFVAGNEINIGSDSILGRDVYIAGNSVKINANIERNLRVACSTIDISGIKIKGNVILDVSSIVMDEKTVIDGKLTYYEGTKVIGKDLATIGEIKIKKSHSDEFVRLNLWNKVYDVIISSMAGLISMLVLFFIMPGTKKKIDKEKIAPGVIAETSLKGLVVLVVVPFISVVAMITGVLLPLSLIALAIYVISVYLASLISAYIVGKELLKKMAKKDNVYLALCIGIPLLKIIAYIPIVGVLTSIVSLLYGLGIIYKFIKTNRE